MKKLSNEEINLLRHNARGMVRELGLLNDAYFEVGVTLAERHLLIELTSCINPTAGEIAERLLLDKSTVSRLIAKAVKKGYVKFLSDEKDKRKRILQFTEMGKKTLNIFEPIAFNQTREALLTLGAEEIEQVYQGIALYAKGLKTSRLRKQTDFQDSSDKAHKKDINVESLFELNEKLNQLGFTLKPFSQEDENSLYGIFKEVVDSGSQFPYECNSIQEFHRQFLNPMSNVYVCHSLTGEVIGGFYIRSNFPGRSNHIANAAYMISSTYRGQGIGTLLVKASLRIAKELGFQAMQFNMVLSQNIIATKLYQKLQFNIIGTIPHAVWNPDGSYQDGYIMHRKLNDL